MQWGVKIPLRDGIRLNATLYRPKDQSEPTPTIFTLTPYIGQTYHEQGVYFAARGYPFLTVDVRGRGDSEGVFQPFINSPARYAYCASDGSRRTAEDSCGQPALSGVSQSTGHFDRLDRALCSGSQ
jgi:predicted acyl esterase